MEGPSIVIATHELEEFIGVKISHASGTSKLAWDKFTNKKLLAANSWGKHLILSFEHLTVRIHFLMFGSYRIDNPRENRIPKMQLSYKSHEIYFYSCAIKEIDKNFEDSYDFSVDVMSPLWDPKNAEHKILQKPQAYICDVLMDQDVFAGVGNIIKNEVLFNLRMHPELRVGELTKKELRNLIKEASHYSHQFYEWKVQNVLKRNWKIFRKKTCPDCHSPVTKEATGKLQRISHYCDFCQSKNKNSHLIMPRSTGHLERAASH